MASSSNSEKGSFFETFGLFLGTIGLFSFRHSRQKQAFEIELEDPQNVSSRRSSLSSSSYINQSFRPVVSPMHGRSASMDHHFDSSIDSVIMEAELNYDFKSEDITHIYESNNGKLKSETTLNPALNGPNYVSKEGERTRPTMEITMSNKSNKSGLSFTKERESVKTMPRRITLIRHGQSEGNVDGGIYQTKPDNALSLTELGWVQARMAGQALRGQIMKQDGDNSIHFVVSPYVRTMETFHGIASAWCDPEKTFSHIKDKDIRLEAWYNRLAEKGLTWHEDPRIREQDFGNYQDIDTMKKAKSERWEFSSFYYRFLNGESASDVFDRVSTFLDSCWRRFSSPDRAENYVFVTHGITIRVLLCRYFRYTVDQYNMMKNPKNCEMIFLGHDGTGNLELDGRCYLEPEEKADSAGCIQTVLKYKFDKILDVGLKNHMKRNIRMSYNESGIE